MTSKYPTSTFLKKNAKLKKEGMQRDGGERSSVMEHMFAAWSLGAESEVTCYYRQSKLRNTH